uniref:F-box domain-containing protein n=1 Tax=Lynx canadensis TaxID=61383 RepID=A0A667HYN7_LYNCA
MEPKLGFHELLHVFSFLEARDLLCAAQVDKVWNEVSGTKELWRQLCLRRWSSCKTSQMTLGTQTWKEYYLCRSELEFRMECGRPEKDFICKAIAGHTGEIDELAYISTKECRFDGQEKSMVCTVSSDSTVRAWDVQEGTEIWSSPLQPAALVNVVTFPRLQLAITVDERGLIKVWGAENGWEQASFRLPTFSSALQACEHSEGPFLLVACAEGFLYALTVPQLQLRSRTRVFPSSPTSLLCSPDCQWVFASTQNSDLGPKVFHTRSLLCLVEDEPPVSTTLPIWLTSRACWAPDETARLMVTHRNDNGTQLVITTYELRTKQSREGVDVVVQQMASFLLPNSMTPPHLMKGHGSQVILLVSGSELALFTIHGVQLAAFQDHQRPITSMWVVSVGLPVLHPHLKSPWPHLTWLFISRTRAESSPLPLTYPCESMCGIKKRSLPSSRAAITCLGAPTDGPVDSPMWKATV